MDETTKKDVKRVERVLRRAFETALIEGFYPLESTYGDDRGGCCALGMLGVIENYYDPTGRNEKMCDVANYAAVLGVAPDDVSGIISGFDGCSPHDDGGPRREAFMRLGKKLREDYFLCDGEDPLDAEVHATG